MGPWAPAWGRRQSRLPHALTHGHTLSAAASPPRACPLLHLEPRQECGNLTLGEGHGASPGLRAPSARPPHHRPWGIGAGGWRGGPAWRGAGTGVRARSRTAPLPLCHGWHPPKLGRRKRSPAGGLCHRKPQPRAGWGREEALPPGLVPAHACASPLVAQPCTGADSHSCTYARARSAHRRPHTLPCVCPHTPPAHARPGGGCTPPHTPPPQPGQMPARAVRTHPVMGACTPSLPGRAARSPPAAVPVYGDGAAWPALPAPAGAGRGRGHRHGPATWPWPRDAGAAASPRA